jgi:hypothetical protein
MTYRKCRRWIGERKRRFKRHQHDVGWRVAHARTGVELRDAGRMTLMLWAISDTHKLITNALGSIAGQSGRLR